MAWIKALKSKKFPFSPIIGGVLQEGYNKFITPTRNYSGTTWTTVNHGGVSDSGTWGAYYYADWSDYECNGQATARITFTPECYGRTCTITHWYYATAGGRIKGRLTIDGSNIYNDDERYGGTIDRDGGSYTFTIGNSGSPYVEVHTEYESHEGSRWSPSCHAGFYDVTIS